MSAVRRCVLDTNVVLSAILFPGSIPDRALVAAQAGVVLATEATRRELEEVLLRSRFDRYLDISLRKALAAAYCEATLLVTVGKPIRACRDARDDKFLEAAFYGRAEALVTGDADLLALHPFHGIAILTPADFLARA